MVEEMLSQTDGVKNRLFASFHERDVRYDIPKIADDEGRRSKVISTLGSIMKKISTTQDTIIQNLK